MMSNVAIAMLISNTVKVAIFAMLAVVFESWWIVLFSILFLSYQTDGGAEG